jgi:hypothetical protein
MVTANGRFKLFDKSGTLLGLNVSDSAFFASVTNGAGVSDPHVRYDRLSGRWFITEITVSNTSNRILIAVSSGSQISSSSSFTFFQFAHDAVGPTPNIDTGHFADYDTLGVDANALYIGVNEFTSSTGTFQNTTGYVVNKANLLAGGLTVTAFRGLAQGSGPGPVTPQGVDNDDPFASEGYFIGVDNAVFSRLDIRRVINSGGVPSISGNFLVDVPSTFLPVDQVALGSTRPLDAIDDRLFAAMTKKNKITGVSSLWTAHNIRVDGNGVGSSTGDRNASRWYQIDNLTTTPTLTQAGTVFSAGSNPVGFWIPSVAANGQGHMALGSSGAGSATAPSVEVVSRLSTDPQGTTPQPGWTLTGVASYNVQHNTTQRWGDYSQVVVDPADDQTLWTFQEYCDASNSWGVLAVKLVAPPPAAPSGANPASVPAGVASTNVTITGTSSAGSGFFDPGPGFANRLAISIGGGVTVNSLTFVDATTVTVNISTVGATTGVKDVTVTNPDGQQSTGNSVLTVAPANTPPTVTLSATTVAPGGMVTATVANGPGNAGDWVGLYATGAPNGTYLDWKYLNNTRTKPATGVTGADVPFTVPATPGTYNVRFFLNDSTTLLATSATITVTPPTVTLSATTVAPGATVTATVANGPGNAGDWVGLYTTGAADGTYIDWKYLNGTRTKPGTGVTGADVVFTMPATAGTYNVRFFFDDSTLKLATSATITVSTPTITLSATTVAPGATVTATIANGPGNPGDWVGLYTTAAPPSTYLDWKYLNGTRTKPATGLTGASVPFTMPMTPGTYNIRFFLNDSTGLLATSQTITVQ